MTVAKSVHLRAKKKMLARESEEKRTTFEGISV